MVCTHENICITRVAEHDIIVAFNAALMLLYSSDMYVAVSQYGRMRLAPGHGGREGDWRKRERYGEMDASGEGGSEIETVTKEEGKQQSTTSIDVSLTPDFNDQY